MTFGLFEVILFAECPPIACGWLQNLWSSVRTRKMSRTPDLERGSKIVYLSFLPRTNGVLSTLGVVRDRFGQV